MGRMGGEAMTRELLIGLIIGGALGTIANVLALLWGIYRE